ncbi:MAG: pyridoxamine 5'-phosphate oxidase family protein [Methylacidiphilaceae bacterium]|nr:pyridoxamine 5'-phosphate oxidase family protein [Candidatus Methylacidiphilaceae bacterium]
MGKRYPALSPELVAFLTEQKLFFVATAAAEGRINLSPKGLDTFRVLSPARVVWLNLTGSGNETASHLREDGRITILFCAFDDPPRIVRLFGRGRAVHPRDSEWDDLSRLFPSFPGARQLIDVSISLVTTSCGFGIPYFRYDRERPTLREWAEAKGEEGIRRYWREKNARTLDGKETGIEPLPPPIDQWPV